MNNINNIIFIIINNLFRLYTQEYYNTFDYNVNIIIIALSELLIIGLLILRS